MTPSARVILDSFGPHGIRVTTVEAVIHRFVLAELNTYRDFSRNSASSRAIPARKQIEKARTDPMLPISWPAEQRGMQGGAELGDALVQRFREEWRRAACTAADTAQWMSDLGLHKSLCNRLLEPFLSHTVIITATEWDNFFTQRCSPLAQPEMRVAAEAIRAAIEGSTPQPVAPGGWHLPYVTGYDLEEILETGWLNNREPREAARQISAARCARVSYETHDGKHDWDADLALAARLIDPGDGASFHASPFEHVCRPATMADVNAGRVPGNLRGWHQYRHELEAGKCRPPEAV